MSGTAVNQNRSDNFLYLNRENLWLDFNWQGLELRADGALQLTSLPVLVGDLPAELATLGDPDGPAGLAVDAEGSVSFTDTSQNRIRKLNHCDQTIVTVPCIGGKGSDLSQLDGPRGLLIPAYRSSLVIADSHNHRVQIFDLASSQLQELFGPSSFGSEVQTQEQAQPWAVAGDDLGNVYVVDHGNHRVQKFNRLGALVPEFWATMSQSLFMTGPSGIAVWSGVEGIRIYIIDEPSHSIFVFDQDGNAVRNDHGQPVAIGAAQLHRPMGIAVTGDTVFVGDNVSHRILAFNAQPDYQFIGEAVGYRGPVAALALDGNRGLLVHPGSNATPLRLDLQLGHRRDGALWSNRFKVAEFPVKWHRLRAIVAEAPGAQLRLFVHTSDDATDRPAVDPNAMNPFVDPRWIPAAGSPDRFAGVDDLFINGAPSRFIWVGAHFIGDGLATATLSQLRIDFDHTTYLTYLPSLYQDQSDGTAFLLRFVSLFETFFGGLEGEISGLVKLFDPQATPKQFLAWLAGWLELELYETWSEEKQRQMIAVAFALYGRRGTAEGLREALQLFAGVNAIIEEPILNAAWWSLPRPAPLCGCAQSQLQPVSCGCAQTPQTQTASCGCSQNQPASAATWVSGETSVLGVTTMLSSSQPQGAVIGTSATLDYAPMITDEEFGEPLFADMAHRFTIQLYRSQLKCAGTLPAVRAILDQEKPAHTDYHLCIVEPRLRVGYQARLGIDTVVAGPPTPTALGTESPDGKQIVLGGDPAGRIGHKSRLGITARVG